MVKKLLTGIIFGLPMLLNAQVRPIPITKPMYFEKEIRIGSDDDIDSISRVGSRVFLYSDGIAYELADTNGYGTFDHDSLTNRDLADQHPISAITALEDSLNARARTLHLHDTNDVEGLDEFVTSRAGSGDLSFSDTAYYIVTKTELADTAAAIRADFPAGGSGGTIQDNTLLYIRAANEGNVAGNIRGQYSVDLQTDRIDATYVASGNSSTIGGGVTNRASGQRSTVSGGYGNLADEVSSTIGGGYVNTANGMYSTVGGGRNNSAVGRGSFVAGEYVNANTYGESVLGMYSLTISGTVGVWVSTDPIFRVGNGKSTSLRSDAFRINKNGDVFIYGDTVRAETTLFKVQGVMFPDNTIQTTASTGGTGTTDSIYNEFTQEWLSNNDTSKRTGTYFIVDSIGFASGGFITGIDTTTALSGAKTASFSHDASVADVGAYTLSTSGAVVISILNLTPTPHRYMQGTIFVDIATNPSALTVNTYSDGGTTGLTEVVVGNPLANAANKMTTITYTAVNNGTETLVTLVYGQEN